jgi:hypothetical protein
VLTSKVFLVGSILWLATFLSKSKISFSRSCLIGVKSQGIFIFKPFCRGGACRSGNFKD